MNDKKFEKLLNKEADKYARENKDAVMKSCGVETKKQKPAILSALPAVAAVVFIAAFAVICYIPVALKNNGTASGTETAETTDTDGVYTQDFGTETSVTEETETTAETATEKVEYDLISDDRFAEYIIRERDGEQLSEKEINEIARYIDNSYTGIDMECEYYLHSEQERIMNERGIKNKSTLRTKLLSSDLEKLNLSDKYPNMDLETVCDILNSGDDFESIIVQFGQKSKAFAFYNRLFEKNSYYIYKLASSNAENYDYIGIYPQLKRIYFCRCTLRDNNNYALYLWIEEDDKLLSSGELAKQTKKEIENKTLTVDFILNNLQPDHFNVYDDE